jgi:hypothetical protein
LKKKVAKKLPKSCRTKKTRELEVTGKTSKTFIGEDTTTTEINIAHRILLPHVLAPRLEHRSVFGHETRDIRGNLLITINPVVPSILLV